MLYQYKGKDYNSKDEMLEDYKNDRRMVKKEDDEGEIRRLTSLARTDELIKEIDKIDIYL
jgi:hypothetical protein